MPDMSNPDRPDIPPETDSEAFETSATGDFLGLEEDLGIPTPTPQAELGEAAMPPVEAGPASAWTEEEPAEAFPEAPDEALAEDQVFSEEELWSDEPELEEDGEETASWLMELDGDDEFLLRGDSFEGEIPGEGQVEEHVPASAGRTWAVRLLFATISIGIGFAGSRYLGGLGILPGSSTPSEEVAVREPGPGPAASTPTEPAEQPRVGEIGEPGPAEEVTLDPGPAEPQPSEGPILGEGPETVEVQPELTAETAEELLPEIAATTPAEESPPDSIREPGSPAETATDPPGDRRSPFVSLTGAGTRARMSPVAPFMRATRTPFTSAVGETAPTPSITVLENTTPAAPGENPGNPGDGGRERRTQVVKVEDMVILPEELSGRLREASAEELSGMWMGASIPLDAIEGQARLLTPVVGRVRVLLGGGEVFEGQLYAVGNRKVWLDTELGKMALLSWQVDRIEHILTRDGSAALGQDGSQDLAGLERVRVRTPGGVFYGKVIDREGDSVTLITDAGARITLEEAVVGPAGHSATRLVDASEAEEEEPEELPESD